MRDKTVVFTNNSRVLLHESVVVSGIVCDSAINVVHYFISKGSKRIKWVLSPAKVHSDLPFK